MMLVLIAAHEHKIAMDENPLATIGDEQIEHSDVEALHRTQVEDENSHVIQAGSQGMSP